MQRRSIFLAVVLLCSFSLTCLADEYDHSKLSTLLEQFQSLKEHFETWVGVPDYGWSSTKCVRECHEATKPVMESARKWLRQLRGGTAESTREELEFDGWCDNLLKAYYAIGPHPVGICLSAKRTEFMDAFDRLCEDIKKYLDEGADTSAGVRVFVHRGCRLMEVKGYLNDRDKELYGHPPVTEDNAHVYFMFAAP